jgi:transposase
MSIQHKLYVGIDIHSKKHTVAILPLALLECSNPPWRTAKTLTIENNASDFQRLDAAIRSCVSTPYEASIAVDHTGGHYSEPIVYFLKGKGYPVYYLETKAVKAARERFLDQESKSDTIDAIGCAYLLYLRDVHGLSFRISAAIPELGSKAFALRSLVLQRWQLSKLASQATNRLHQFLLAVFPEGEAQCFKKLLLVTPYYSTPKEILRSHCLQMVEGLSDKEKNRIVKLARNTVGVENPLYASLIKDMSTQRMEFIAKRDALTSKIREEVVAHPYGEILLSFPHLGEVIAATIIGVVRDINRWPDKKKFKKGLGVYSNLAQSGTAPARTKRGREGSRHGRRALFLVCFGCAATKARENDFKDYYLARVARGKPRIKALVSTAGKLAEIIYHCLKAREPYQYQGKYKKRTCLTTRNPPRESPEPGYQEQ